MRDPRLLHKYVGSSFCALENMAQGRLKFTPIDQLNDPAEMVATLRAEPVRRSLEDLREGRVTLDDVRALQDQWGLLNRLAPGEIRADLPASPAEIVELARAEIFEGERFLERPRKLAAIFREKTAIFSLTENPADLRMWASYGDAGKGWLVTLRDVADAFAARALPGLYSPLRANYDPDDPGVTFRPDSFLSFFTKKHPEWESEREWRVVGVLDDCNRDNPDCPLIQIGPEHVFGFTAGWQVDDNHFEAIQSKLLKLNPALHVAKLTLNDARRPSLPAYLHTET